MTSIAYGLSLLSKFTPKTTFFLKLTLCTLDSLIVHNFYLLFSKIEQSMSIILILFLAKRGTYYSQIIPE